MSDQNFFSYGDAESVLANYANKIKNIIVQVSTMPTASSELLGKIYQYVGTTITSYTNGYFYRCVEGSILGTYEWQAVNVQEDGGSSVQSDWNQTDTTADDYIKNKPIITNSVTQSSTDLITSGGVYAAIDEAIMQVLNTSY